MPENIRTSRIQTTVSKRSASSQTSARFANHRERPEQTDSKTGKVTGTNGAGLRIRKGPGTNYSISGKLSEGAVVNIVSEQNNWYYIQYGSKTGFVSKKYITLNSGTENDKSVVDGEEEAGKEKQADPIGTATVKVASLTVREGPGNMYNRAFGLSMGKSVSVLEKKDGWIKISCQNQTGWVYGPYTDFDSFSSGTVTGDAELANFIRDNYPNGINVCFAYNGESANEFISQAKKFSNTYNTINISNGKLAKQVYQKITKYSELKSNILAVTAGVRKCLADNPRPGFDDAKCSVIKNLSILCHGFTTGLNLGGGSSNHFKIGKVDEFASVVKGYLADDVRVQLYACSTARNSKTDESWYERKSGSHVPENDPFKGGEGSFAQKLAEALGGNASVYGHTTTGHITGNRCGRVYGKDADYAPNGKFMYDVWFPKSFISEQANRLGKSEQEIRDSLYSYYCSNYGGDCQGRDTFIDPEGKGERMRAGWLAQNP